MDRLAIVTLFTTNPNPVGLYFFIVLNLILFYIFIWGFNRFKKSGNRFYILALLPFLTSMVTLFPLMNIILIEFFILIYTIILILLIIRVLKIPFILVFLVLFLFCIPIIPETYRVNLYKQYQKVLIKIAIKDMKNFIIPISLKKVYNQKFFYSGRVRYKIYQTPQREKDFKNSEKVFNQNLIVFTKLAKAYPKRYLWQVASTYRSFSFCCNAHKRYKMAEEMSKKALKIYRKIEKLKPGSKKRTIADLVETLAKAIKYQNREKEAKRVFGQSLKLYKEVAKANRNKFEIYYAKRLIKGVLVFNRDKKELDEAKKILLKYSKNLMAKRLLFTIKIWQN